MFKKFVTVQVLLALATPFTAHAASHCNPEKSKPCGMSCIRKEFTCHKATTTATVATPAKVSK